MSQSYNQRFGGIRRLYGDKGAEIIRGLHVCVVGIGGVGSWAIEALARSGVNTITLIDHDDICETNINRQLHALTETLGLSKVDVMAERIKAINPDCQVHAVDDFITETTLEKYLNLSFDYVIDAIDSIRFKAAMIYYCKRNKIPVITIGGAGGLTDPTQISVKDLSKTINDPLAAKVRSTLRREYQFAKNTKRSFGVECVFSAQQQVYPKADGSVSQQKPGVKGVSLDCSMGFGASTCVTSVFGFIAVSRVIEKSLNKKLLR
ncbi:MAG: tRNA cyclic N6-threonylcarbamoyladenosine(37) synthase TcdA [Gammaproteobacteria bacterium]|nr:tRNA cyclic N6-threonylcarbamoyladenosine(37) synthase TcdA [Gammaproteobacteria bacterium]